MIYEELTAENLITICKTTNCADSYLASPAYYLMTGRKGGAIFRNGHKALVAVKHPNVEDCILVFPAISSDNCAVDLSWEFEIASTLMERHPDKTVKVARVPQEIAEKYPQNIVDEDLLDWIYPVYILGVDDLLSLKGKRFAQIRQRINNLNTASCTVKSIDIRRDYDVILGMTLNWAKSFPYAEYDAADLISPTQTLLWMMRDPKLNIFGHIIYYNDRPASYCIWEECGDIANAYAMSADRNLPGLAEYNYLKMCEQLFHKGIERVNIGGSESSGLNRFKLKFSPVESLCLKSCVIG